MICDIPLKTYKNYAIPARGTVLDELISGERGIVRVFDKELSIPDPSELPKKKIIVLGKEMEAVILRPPFTFLDKIISAGNDTMKAQAWNGLKSWVHGKGDTGAYGKALEKCCSFKVPAVRAYNMCHPAVPENEVWTTVGKLSKHVHLMRFPTASEAAMEKVTLKKVRFNYPIIFTNPARYKYFHGGDSDGDHSNLCNDVSKPYERAEVTDLPDLVFNLTSPEVKIEIKQQDTVSIVRGYQAKRLVGLITWFAWKYSAANKARLGYPFAYNEAWRFFGNLLELAFDGRKDGREFNNDIILALEGKQPLPEGLAADLGCPEMDKTIYWANHTKQSVGFRIWLGRFKNQLPTNMPAVIKALKDVWEGNYEYTPLCNISGEAERDTLSM